MSIVRYPIAGGSGGGEGPFTDANTDVTGAAVGQVVAVGQVGPLGFDLRDLAPPIARSATVYAAPNGSDSADGRTWATAKQSIAAALTALGADGGTVELGAGTFSAASTGRMASCTFTAGSTTVACATIASGDVGAYIIGPYLRSPALITNVNPGVSCTITDQSGLALTPESSGTSVSIITKPAVIVPPGVRILGRGSEWTTDQSAQNGVLNHANTWITDSGTGVTVLCGHPQDGGAANSGQRASGTWLERFAIKGNASNLFGLAQINNWYVVAKNVDCVGHGVGGLLVAANANATRFTDCRFGGNGTAAATAVTGGAIVLENVPKIPFGPVKFDNCFFTNNWGWGLAGTADFATPRGARSVRVSQGQFNHAKASTVTGSGTHAAVSGDEYRSLLDDCIFESADFLNLDVYDAPVTVVACKFKATGGTNGTLTHTIRLNTNALLEAIGCGLLDSTSYHVQVGTGATFQWRSCVSPNGSFTLAADASGQALALQNAAGSPAGSTTSPVEPLVGAAGSARANETCPRLLVNSAAIPVTHQVLNLTYFTATKSAAVSQVAVEVGATASGGSAAYIGVGLFQQNSDGTLTLLAATSGANANAFTAANASVTLNLAAATFVTAGRRYAIGVLVASGNALPTFRGVQSASLSLSGLPALTHTVTGQTTMPASVASGSLVSAGAPIYARLI